MAPKRNQPQLTLRVVRVHVPGCEHAQHTALEQLGQAIADRMVEQARAEVAEKLGVSADSIDRERGQLDDEALRYLELDGAVAPTRAA